MDIIVTSARMQARDRYATERLGLPSSLLMENAGREVAGYVCSRLGESGRNDVAVVCGKGNNGGDGFVAARHLLARGVCVRVILIGRPSDLKGDPLMNFNVLRSLAKEEGAGERLDIVVDPTGRRIAALREPGIIVDALFGTGLRGKLSGAPLRAVGWINRRKAPAVSIDIPSGLDADNGTVGNECVRAAATVTMGLTKAGLLIGRGPELSGTVVTASLGFPPGTRRQGDGEFFLVGESDIRAALPTRPFNAHKHSVGKILVLAGSVGFTGAASLTAMSAMKSGAGAVILATPAAVYPILARKLTEVMVKPVGEASDRSFTGSALTSLARDLDWADVIIVGPGIGLSPETGIFIEKLTKMTGKRFLFDADALNHISRLKAPTVNLRRNTCILTPHTGEFSRLTRMKPAEIEDRRIEVARTFAKNSGGTLLLKGAPTITADRKGGVFVNSTGNKGMATAGMGDVLAGLVGAIWAESGDSVSAAYAGAAIHGEAGDRVASRIGFRSLMAGDLLNELPQVIEQYSNNGFY